MLLTMDNNHSEMSVPTKAKSKDQSCLWTESICQEVFLEEYESCTMESMGRIGNIQERRYRMNRETR